MTLSPPSSDGRTSRLPVRLHLFGREVEWSVARALIIVVVVFALLAAPATRASIGAMDEGALLLYPTLVQHGEIPHRDFETMYGPGNLYILALAFSTFDPSVAVERSIGIAYRLAIVLALFLLSQRRGTQIALAAAILGAALTTMTIGVAAFAWMGAIALGLLAVCLSLQGRYLWAGLLAGLALVFRPDLVLAISAAAIILRSWRYVIGVALGLIPYIFHVATAGPTNVISGMIVDPVFRSSGRRLPLPVNSLMFWIVMGSIGFITAVGVGFFRRNGDRDLLLVAVFAACLLPQAIQRPDPYHLVFVGCVSIPLIPLFLSSLIGNSRRTGMVCLIAAGAFAVVPLGLGTVGMVEGTSRDGIPLTHEHRTVYVPTTEMRQALSGLLHRIDREAGTGARLFVGPADLARTVYNDTFIYFLEPNLLPASYFLEMNPGSANRPNSRLAADVMSADFVVLTHLYDSWDEPNASAAVGDTSAQEVLENEFCEVERFGPWELLRRCAATAGLTGELERAHSTAP